MTVDYPDSLDSFSNPTGSNFLDDGGVTHTDQHTNANDAIEALEAKLGTGADVAADEQYLMGSGAGESVWATAAAALIPMMKLVYPVGAIYISTLSTNPATLFGFGTWAAFGAGC
jgi:hypothetical protein